MYMKPISRLLPGLLLLGMATNFCSAQKMYLLAGTYTGTGSRGIYVYSFDDRDGHTTLLGSTDTASNPSFVVFSHDHRFVYAVNETHGDDPGRVSAYAFNTRTGALRFINSRPSRGDDPCHLAVSGDDRWLTVANYTSGSAAAFPLEKDGSIGANAAFIQDSGSSVNPDRQASAHVHETVFSPDGRYLFTPDLGADKIMIYRFIPSRKDPLVPAAIPFLKIPAGYGPRHLIFSKDKNIAYVICELKGMVLVYHYGDGKFRKVQEIAAHPEGYNGVMGSAELGLAPDGKFLYASNRGDENTITIFSVNPVTGVLKTAGYQTVEGVMPRNFILDPSGRFLLVANQGSDNIVIFKRNAKSGLLSPLSDQIHVAKPVCLQMIPAGH